MPSSRSRVEHFPAYRLVALALGNANQLVVRLGVEQPDDDRALGIGRRPVIQSEELLAAARLPERDDRDIAQPAIRLRLRDPQERARVVHVSRAR